MLFICSYLYDVRGDDYVLGMLKKEMKRAQKHSDLHGTNEQSFCEALQARLSVKTISSI